jgi:DNA-binding response OmpR family regulator
MGKAFHGGGPGADAASQTASAGHASDAKEPSGPVSTAPGSRPRILVIDDEAAIRSALSRALAAERLLIDLAETAADGLSRARAEVYDLIILDLLMPGTDGFAALRQLLRDRPGQTVLVLSCLADVQYKVDCFDLGARDYMTKPFSLAELLARVRVRLRDDAHEAGGPGHAEPRPLMPPLTAPRHSGTAVGELIRAGQVTLDVGRLVADIGHGPVPLTRLEFLLLRELAEHAGESVSKGRLLASVWGYDFDPGSNVVDVCVRRIRSKLGFELIKTVRGEGYQLVS